TRRRSRSRGDGEAAADRGSQRRATRRSRRTPKGARAPRTSPRDDPSAPPPGGAARPPATTIGRAGAAVMERVRVPALLRVDHAGIVLLMTALARRIQNVAGLEQLVVVPVADRLERHASGVDHHLVIRLPAGLAGPLGVHRPRAALGDDTRRGEQRDGGLLERSPLRLLGRRLERIPQRVRGRRDRLLHQLLDGYERRERRALHAAVLRERRRAEQQGGDGRGGEGLWRAGVARREPPGQFGLRAHHTPPLTNLRRAKSIRLDWPRDKVAKTVRPAAASTATTAVLSRCNARFPYRGSRR